MLCEKFDTRLHEVLDQRERPELDARLRDHALTCDDCADKLAAQASLFDGFRAAPAPVPGRDFTDRVLASLQTRQKNAAWGKIVWSLVALAAVLLVAVVPVWWLLDTGQNGGSGGSSPGGEGASVAQDRPVSAPDPRPDPRPTTVVGSGTNDAPKSLDQPPRPDTPHDGDPAPGSTGESAVAIDSGPSPENDSREGLFGEGIMPWEIAANFPGVDAQRAEMIQSIWTERVATPLEPVTSSVTGAVNVLRRTLAVGPALQDDTDDQKPQAGVTDGVRIKDLV
jgi:hypothetical protein